MESTDLATLIATNRNCIRKELFLRLLELTNVSVTEPLRQK